VASATSSISGFATLILRAVLALQINVANPRRRYTPCCAYILKGVI